MTTFNDDLKNRVNNLGKGRVETDGVTKTSFGDPTGAHPRLEYQYSSSVNIGARTGKTHKLSFGGAVSGVPADVTTSTGNQYPYNDVRETLSGHVLEFNDTPGGERILIRHASGSGVEMRPDGTIVVSTLSNKVEVCNGDNTVIVEGDANMVYKGNLTLDVTGDFNVNCLNYNVNVKSDKKETVDGSSRTKVFGNHGLTVSGHKTETVAQTVTTTNLGAYTQTIKGNYSKTIEGTSETAISGAAITTSQKEISFTAPNMNIAGTSMSIFGNTGTIGGENIIMYNYNMYTGHSISAGDTVSTNTAIVTERVTSKEFVGSLTGNADTASSAPTGSAGTKVTGSPTAVNTTATALPTASLLSQYLEKTSRGVRKVAVDTGDYIKNQLQERKLSTDGVRAKLRDPSNLSNPEFTAKQVAAGKLNPSWSNTVPPGGVGRIRESDPGCERGDVKMGNANPAGANKTYRRPKPSPTVRRVMIPEQEYNVNLLTEIKPSTKLSKGITMAKFLGGKSASDFKNLSHDDRKQLARNYFLHAQIIKQFMTRPGPQSAMFTDHRLEVVEGYYKPERYGVPTGNTLSPETISANSLLAKRATGQVVVYELIGPDGKIDVDNTFEAATFIKDRCSHIFKTLTLDYDEFDPSGEMNAQIIIEVNNVDASWSYVAGGQVLTYYNSKLQAKDSLVEILQTPTAKPPIDTTTQTQQTIVTEDDVSKAYAEYIALRTEFENLLDKTAEGYFQVGVKMNAALKEYERLRNIFNNQT